MSDITYTRITPNGEEKCSLLDGDGMTIEGKKEAIKEVCESNGAHCVKRCGANFDCPLFETNGSCLRDSVIDRNYRTLVDAGLIKPPVNFVKASPDDEVESEGDAVESDAVNHPNHYTQNGIECIAAIRASMTADGFMDYCKGNVLKYLWRWRDKGGVEDLHKARVYLDWLIEEASK